MKMLRRIRIYLVFYENEYNCSEICILLNMYIIKDAKDKKGNIYAANVISR